MRRIVFREGVSFWRRQRALKLLEGWHVRAVFIGPRTYNLHGQPPILEALIRAFRNEALIETPDVRVS